MPRAQFHPARGAAAGPYVRSDTLVVAAVNSKDTTNADYFCDGTSDETEINLALNALPAGGGVVKLMEGTFTVDGPIVIPDDNVALIGTGPGTIITIPNGHDANLNIISATSKNHLLIADLLIDGNKANQAAGDMIGIYFETVTYSKIVHCWVENLFDAGETGGYGIQLTTTSNYNTLTGNTCQGNLSGGIFLDSSGSNTITGNTVQGNTFFFGIGLIASSDNTITGNTVQGNVPEGEGIYLEESNDNTITGNTCQGNGSNGIGVAGSNYNTLTGNTCQGNTFNGIQLYAATNTTVAGNTVVGNSQEADNTNDGIVIDEDSDYNNIQNNTVRRGVEANKQRYGINIATDTCNENIVIDNDLYDSGTTGCIQDLGTDTKLEEVQVPIVDDTDTNATLTNHGDFLCVEMANDQDVTVRCSFRVPSDFQELVRARVVVIPEGTGNLRRGVTTDWGLCGELYTAGGAAIALGQVAVTINEVECLDVDAALAGITAGDHVGLAFQRDGVDALDTVDAAVNVVMFWMQYV